MTDVATQAPTITETPLPLPRYQCHKVVEALKIEHIAFGNADGGATIHPVDTRYPPFRVPSEYMSHPLRAGGYWVRYDDGYESFSPAKTFEEGYTLLPALSIEEAQKALREGRTVTIGGGLMTTSSQPMPLQGPAAQNLYPQLYQEEMAATIVSDPDTHA